MAEERSSDVGYPIHAYRVARAEMAGDLERAVTLLPDPAVAGGNPVYTSHIHALRARVFFNAGQEAQAREEFSRMREMVQLVPGADVIDGIAIHGPANAFLDEALPVLADEAYIDATVDTFHAVLDTTGKFLLFSPVSMSSIPRVGGVIFLLRGRIDEAEQLLRRALESCEQERCPVEAGRCLQGLAEVAERRGNSAEALPLLDRAAELFQEHGAKLYLDRVIATKLMLQGVASGEIKTSIDAVAATVLANQPDLRQHAAPDGTVTILFSDIESHTAINERLGDQRWMEVLREHNTLVREQIQSHEGYEVKTEGDGFMVAFGSARKAIQCAIAMQRAFAKRNNDADEPVLVRIGLHTGEPVQENNDFYGTQVTQAARIADEADGGEILVSALLKELTEAGGDIEFIGEREVELKGLGTQRVYAISW